MSTTNVFQKWGGAAVADSSLKEEASGIVSFSGSTSASPGLLRNGNVLEAKLADNSGFACHRAKSFDAQSGTGIGVFVGGATSGDVGLKRVSGPVLEVRKGDDSDFAEIHTNNNTSENMFIATSAGFSGLELWQKSAGASGKRWAFIRGAGDTGSSNGGSDLDLYHYDDSGNPLGVAMHGNRASGIIDFPAGLTRNSVPVCAIVGSSPRQAELSSTGQTTAQSFALQVNGDRAPAGLYVVTFYLIISAAACFPSASRCTKVPPRIFTLMLCLLASHPRRRTTFTTRCKRLPVASGRRPFYVVGPA